MNTKHRADTVADLVETKVLEISTSVVQNVVGLTNRCRPVPSATC